MPNIPGHPTQGQKPSYRFLRHLGVYRDFTPIIMENQMEKKMENEMETGII